MEHAYPFSGSPGRVRVEVAAETDGGIRVAVADGGTWRPVPADRGFRGRGLDLIAALTEDVVDHGPSGTVKQFRLHPAAEPVPTVLPATPGAAGSATLVATDASGRRCLELAGDLDPAGVDTVRAELFRELAGGIPVTLDLTRLGFVASVGLGLLLELRADPDRADLDVVLPDSGPAGRVLDLAGLTGVLVEPARTPAADSAQARSGLPRRQVLVDEGDGGGALPSGGRDPLDRPGTDVPGGEDPGQAGLQEHRRAGQPPAGRGLGREQVRARAHVPPVVEGDRARQPGRPRFRADEHEQRGGGQVSGRAAVPLPHGHRLQSR